MQIPRQWRLKQQRYSLSGQVCLKCGTKTFNSRPVCPVCGMGTETVEEQITFQPVSVKEPVLMKRG